MAIFYSASAGGFLDDAIHKKFPADAVPISAERYAELLEARSAGNRIEPDADGAPRIAKPRKPSLADRRAAAIAAVKREARRRIESVAPIWLQINDMADLARCAAAGLDAPDEAWRRRERIDAIRAASNALEAEIAGMTYAQLDRLDIATASHWPA